MSEDELNQLLDEKDSKSSKNVLKQALDIYIAKQKELTSKKWKLNTLRKSYVNAYDRSTQRCGEQMENCTQRDSMITIRYTASLQRHFLKTKSIDIVNSGEFKRANDICCGSTIKPWSHYSDNQSPTSDNHFFGWLLEVVR